MVNIFRDRQNFLTRLKRLKAAMLLLVFLGIARPAIAQEENRNSRLRIEFDLDRRGRPTNLEVIESSGNRKFDKATLDAMEKMRFERSDANRQGISADINIEFNGLNAYEYPPEIVNSFVDSCSNGDGDSYGFCVCTMEAVQKRYPLETFIAVSLDMSNGNMSPQVEEFFRYMLSACITEVPVEQFFPSP